MRPKKILSTAVVVLAAIACAAPSTASALTLTDMGQEVKDKDFVQGGNFKFLAQGGTSISCPMKLTFTIDGKTVTVRKFELTALNDCATEGLFEDCTVTNYSPDGLSWAVTVDATVLTIKDVTVTTTFGSVPGKTCPYKNMKMSYEPWLAKPDDPKGISKFSWLGVGKGELESEEEGESELEIESEAEAETEEENITYAIG